MILCLVKEDGTISRNQKEILGLQNQFYQRLYKSNPEINFQFFNNSDKQLSQEDKERLDQKVTLEELTGTVKDSQLQKMPGCDGLLAEIFTLLWEQLSPILLKALNYGF